MRVSTNHLQTVLFQHPVALEIKRTVQGSLSTHCRQQGIGPFALDDFFHSLPGDRLNIGHVRRFRIGHDGRGVAVDQNGSISLCFQGFARLGTGIIKLAGLANDDGASANDQNAFYVSTFGHELLSASHWPSGP